MPRPPIVVALYDNLIPTENMVRAKVALQELIELIGAQVNYPTKLVIVPGRTQQAINRADEAIARGEIHLMPVTGLEYGWWLQSSRGSAEIIALCDPGGQASQYEELVVLGGGKFKRPADLRGARLATYEKPFPSLTIYVNQLRRSLGADFLSAPPLTVDHAVDALHAVVDGQADAAIVDIYTRLRFAKVYSTRAERLVVIDNSPPYPLPVIVGNRANIERLRKGLWAQLQTALFQIHNEPRSAAFLDVWAQRGFNPPPPNYEIQVKDAAAKYQFSELPTGR